MKILTITSDYPYGSSYKYIFVKQLMDKFVALGHEVIVISPQSITKTLLKRTIKRPYKYIIKSNDKKYHLYSPKFISFSNIPILSSFSLYLYRKSVLRVIKKEKLEFDIVYAHFLKNSGTAAYLVSKHYKKPYFVAFGEAWFDFNKSKKIIDTFDNAKGFIAVSTEMKERLLAFYNVDESKISVHSNGFDSKLFYKIDKQTIRTELNIDNDSFVVSFVGGFTYRKGTLRLSQALKEINNPNIKAIFIGVEYDEKPDYEHIIYQGPLSHQDIVKYLNASDVFVLPTLNEGSCNAIIEAIACGLPIISSNKTFNDDILNDTYSIRINSMSIEDIKEAIRKIYNDEQLRKKMSLEAYEASKRFDLNARAKNILKFIGLKIKQ